MGNKPQRLITFGCSFTYGSGLPDCIESSRGWQQPSNYSWASILANKLSCTLENQSWPGASNLEILYKILNFDFKDNDYVVIMWTVPLRDLKFKRLLTPFQQLGPWMQTSLARKWLMSADDYDYIQRSWIYLHHAELFLNSKKIKHLHFPAYKWEVGMPGYLDTSNILFDGLVHCDNAVDGHPGIESNKQTAQKIFKHINEQ